MEQTLRDTYLSQKVQAHLSDVILNTLNAVVFVGYKNKNLNDEQHQSIKRDFTDAKGRDITVVARLLRNSYNFTDSRRLVRQKSILSLCRNINDDHKVFLKEHVNQKSDNIKKLYNILRELSPLVQNLIYYRNFCSHNMNVVSQTGWELAVISSVVRTCEISLIDKSGYQINTEIIETFISFVRASFETPVASSTTETKSIDQKSLAKTQKQTIDLPPLYQRLDEITSSLAVLSSVEEKLDKFLQSAPEKDVMQANNVSEVELFQTTNGFVQAEGSDLMEDDETKNETYDDVNTITPEILRQRLQEISFMVKSKYQNLPGFGARANLLQVANIGIILQREPGSLDELLGFEEIRSRIDLNDALIREQIADYGDMLSDLFSNVIWQSVFDFE